MNKFKKKMDLGGYMKFAQGAETVNRAQDKVITNTLNKKLGVTDEESAIINQGTNITNGIPGVDFIADKAVNTFNSLSGKTSSRLNSFNDSQHAIDVANQSGYVDASKASFAMGGNMSVDEEPLVDINGPSHENNPLGGIPMANNLMEGDEKKFGNFIFSKRLGFAQVADKLQKKDIRGGNDKLYNEYLEGNNKIQGVLPKLAELQEQTKMELGIPTQEQMVYGGWEDEIDYSNPFKAANSFGFDPNQTPGDETTMPPEDPFSTPSDNLKSLKPNAKDFPSLVAPGVIPPPQSLPGMDNNGNLTSVNPGLQNIEPQTNYDTMSDPNQIGDIGKYIAQGSQLIAPLKQIGLKPSPVKYPRMVAKSINPTAAITLGNKAFNRQANTVQSTIKNNAPTTGSLLSNTTGAGTSLAERNYELAAGTQYNADVANVGAENDARKMNTEIGIKQSEDTQREKDFAFDMNTKGYQNLGKVATGIYGDDQKEQMQDIIKQNLGTANWKLSADGKTITYVKNGKIGTVNLQDVIPATTEG